MVGAGARLPGRGAPGPAGRATAGVTSPRVAPDAADDDVDAAEVEAALRLVLVRRAQSGDPQAFAELYDRYVDTVFRYVLFRVRDRALAEDLTSETFARALRGLAGFSWQGRDIGAWFVTIARNLVADHYKSSRYRLELTTDDVAAVAPGALVAGPEETVLDGLQVADVLDAVRALGPQQQECIALRFLHGLSVAETARVMGKNDAAIKALQHRAVRALGRRLPQP